MERKIIMKIKILFIMCMRANGNSDATNTTTTTTTTTTTNSSLDIPSDIDDTLHHMFYQALNDTSGVTNSSVKLELGANSLEEKYKFKSSQKMITYGDRINKLTILPSKNAVDSEQYTPLSAHPSRAKQLNQVLLENRTALLIISTIFLTFNFIIFIVFRSSENNNNNNNNNRDRTSNNHHGRRTKSALGMNTLLKSKIICQIIVNILFYVSVIYELPYLSDRNSTYNWLEATYISIHEFIVSNTHAISVLLDCIVIGWRYFASRQVKPLNLQSVKSALSLVVGVAIIPVVISRIPLYRLIPTLKERKEFNVTKYQVSLSKPINEWSTLMKFYFCILTCCTNLIPCLLMLYYTIGLKRQLSTVRSRRLGLTLPGSKSVQDISKYIEMFTFQGTQDNSNKRVSLINQQDTSTVDQQDDRIDCPSRHSDREFSESRPDSRSALIASTSKGPTTLETEASLDKNINRILKQQYEASSQETDLKYVDKNGILNPCRRSSTSDDANRTSDQVNLDACTSIRQKQQSPPRGQLLVNSNDTATFWTTVVPPRIEISPDSDQEHNIGDESNNNNHYYDSDCDDDDDPNHLSVKTIWLPNYYSELRPASAFPNLQPYSSNNNSEIQDADRILSAQLAKASNFNASTDCPRPQSLRCDDHATNYRRNSSGKIIRNSLSTPELIKQSIFIDPTKSSNRRSVGSIKIDRSVGSTSMSPVSILSLISARKQIRLNQLADRLSTYVMISFLVCELPLGIFTILCIYLEKYFHYEVLQNSRVLIHLSYVIGGSVKLALNCIMSSNFRERLNDFNQKLFGNFRWRG